LTEEQVLGLLEGGLPDGRIVQIVGTCHIGFFPSVDVIDELANRKASATVLEAIRNDGYQHITLAQARGEVGLLERKIAEISSSNNSARDSELARLDAEFAPRLAVARQVSPQDQFESDAAFAARKGRAESAAADLVRDLENQKQRISQRYADDVSASTKFFQRQLAGLKERTYEDEGTKAEFLRYDADQNRLMAKLGETEYWFTVPNDKAREFYTQWWKLRVERGFEEDTERTRFLVEPPSGDRYAGIPREIEEEKERAATAAAAAAAEEERQQREALARLVWVDESTRLMWTRQDNGSDINWTEAVSYCRNLRLGDYSDWRLPEIGELAGIYDASQAGRIKGGIRLTSTWVWSGTRNGSGEAWRLYFDGGYRYSGLLSVSDLKRALCVRRVGG